MTDLPKIKGLEKGGKSLFLKRLVSLCIPECVYIPDTCKKVSEVVWLQVFSMLNAKELELAKLVCKYWRNLVNKSELHSHAKDARRTTHVYSKSTNQGTIVECPFKHQDYLRIASNISHLVLFVPLSSYNHNVKGDKGLCNSIEYSIRWVMQILQWVEPSSKVSVVLTQKDVLAQNFSLTPSAFAEKLGAATAEQLCEAVHKSFSELGVQVFFLNVKEASDMEISDLAQKCLQIDVSKIEMCTKQRKLEFVLSEEDLLFRLRPEESWNLEDMMVLLMMVQKGRIPNIKASSETFEHFLCLKGKICSLSHSKWREITQELAVFSYDRKRRDRSAWVEVDSLDVEFSVNSNERLTCFKTVDTKVSFKNKSGKELECTLVLDEASLLQYSDKLSIRFMPRSAVLASQKNSEASFLIDFLFLKPNMTSHMLICVKLSVKSKKKRLKVRAAEAEESRFFWLRISMRSGDFNGLREISYEKIRKLPKEFVGRGGCAVVEKLSLEGKVLAMKTIEIMNEGEFDAMQLSQFRSEVSLLSKLQHPNIVKLHAICCDNIPHLALFYTFYPYGSLKKVLTQSFSISPVPRQLAVKFALEIAKGMNYLHLCGIINRDLKSDNVTKKFRFFFWKLIFVQYQIFFKIGFGVKIGLE